MIVIATFNEDIVDTPPIQITGTGLEPIAATNMTRDSNRTFHYFWTASTGDGTQTFTLSQGTDLAGNVMASTSTTIIVDSTAPTAELTYTVDGSPVTRVNVGDVVRITATFNEDMALFPTAQITGTGVDSIAAASMTRANARTYYYLWTVVSTDGGTQTFTLSRGEDSAGNVVVSEPTSGGTIEVDLNNCKSFAGRYDT